MTTSLIEPSPVDGFLSSGCFPFQMLIVSGNTAAIKVVNSCYSITFFDFRRIWPIPGAQMHLAAAVASCLVDSQPRLRIALLIRNRALWIRNRDSKRGCELPCRFPRGYQQPAKHFPGGQGHLQPRFHSRRALATFSPTHPASRPAHQPACH